MKIYFKVEIELFNGESNLACIANIEAAIKQSRHETARGMNIVGDINRTFSVIANNQSPTNKEILNRLKK